MSDIFISYCRDDFDHVNRIVNKLQNKGFSIWWDKKIDPGKFYDEIIVEQINSAKCVLVFWSNRSVHSDWVKDEAEVAKNKKNLIPVLIEDVTLPLGFGRIQTSNLINLSDHNNIEMELNKLYNAINNIIIKPTNNKNNELKSNLLIDNSLSPKNNKKIILFLSSLFLTSFIILLAFYVKYIIKPSYTNETIYPSKIFTNSINMKFVLIEPGNFIMGDTSEPSENFNQYLDTQHRVEITEPFYIQTTEVTQSQWKSIMGQNPSKFNNCESCPVENVSWNDAHSFVTNLNIKEKEIKYRLPYEAEWEYACQKGNTTVTNNLSSKTEVVTQYIPNSLGIYGMADNVYEWCFDWHGEYPNYAVKDPNGPTRGKNRINRGGSWHNSQNLSYNICTNRGFDQPDYKTPYIGFRVAASVK